MLKATIWASVLLTVASAATAAAQDVRAHTRLDRRGTKVSKSQAEELTLTVSEAAVRAVQTWVRTAGAIGKDGKTITAYLDTVDAGPVKVGQRVRAFPPEARSSMYQAKVMRVERNGERVMVQAMLSGPSREGSTNYVLEIVADRGDFLSVPNEAIIEEGDRHIVYLQRPDGQYEPQEIHTGVQGERYTQVVDGLKVGDQVVTFGSFFIDSEYKLKGTAQSGTE